MESAEYSDRNTVRRINILIGKIINLRSKYFYEFNSEKSICYSNRYTLFMLDTIVRLFISLGQDIVIDLPF